MRINVKLIIEQNAIFLPYAIYDILADAFRAVFIQHLGRYSREAGFSGAGENNAEIALFSFSDIMVARKKYLSAGFWVVGKANVLATSPATECSFEQLCGIAGLNTLTVGNLCIDIQTSIIPHKSISAGCEMICLSPIVVAADEGKDYLVYEDDPAFYSERLRQGLIQKYLAYHGQYPSDDRFMLFYNENYLKIRGGIKVVNRVGQKLTGYFAPFTMVGSQELIDMAYNAGLGEKTDWGFGMIDNRESKRLSNF